MDNAEEDIDFEILLSLFADAADTITEPGAVRDLIPPWGAAQGGSWPGLTMPQRTGPVSHALDFLSEPFSDLIDDMAPFGLVRGPLPPLARAQTPQPMPNFGPSLGQAPLPTAPNPAASRSSKGKKRPSNAQQVQELEEELEKQALLAKSLAMSNIWLCEKQRVINLIIQANDGQLARGRMVQRGLDFNPFVGLKTNMEAVGNATPKSIAETILTSIGTIAMQLAAVQPLLQTNPHLLTESTPPCVAPPALPSQPIGLGPVAKPYLPELVDHTHVHMMPELHQLLDDVRKVCSAWSFLFHVHPKLLQAGNVRLHALKGSSASWETLASTMLEQHCRGVATAGGRQGTADSLPVMAPEVKWRNTVASLKLTDRQRLRCAVLWNILDSARKKVHQQRAQLGAAMSQLLQPPTPPPTTAPAAAAATATTAAAATAGIAGNRSMSNVSDSMSGGPQSSGLVGSSPKSGGSPRSVAGGGITSAGGSSNESLGPGLPAGITTAQAGGGGASGGYARMSADGGGGGGGGSSGCTDAYARAVVWKTPAVLHQEQVLLEQLQHTLIKERCLILLGQDVFFRQILTPVQDAVALVSCYPYMPDLMAIIGAAATEFQPDVLDRLLSVVATSTTPGIHLHHVA